MPTWFLPARKSTATLPPTAASTCAKQRGGHLRQPQAAQVGGGDEARQVADDPATQGHDHVVAPQAALVEDAVQLLGAGERLLRLAGRQDDCD